MKDIIDLTGLPPESYIIVDQWGDCHVCGKYDDLRYGSCFDCSDFVMTDEKEAWDVRNPSSRWSVRSH